MKLQFVHGVVIAVIPPEEVKAFAEVVRRGMNFEHGEPQSFHMAADQLSAYAQINESAGTPAQAVPPGTPLPGTMLLSG